MRYGLFVLALVAIPSVASADIVPEGYVEHCTLEEVGRTHTGCVACGSSFQTPDGCSTQHASDGLQMACRTNGASVWTEIWCASAAPPPSSATPPPPTTRADPSTPPPAESSSCNASPAQHGGWLALLMPIALLLHRKKKA